MDRQAVIEKWNERYRQGHDDLQMPLPFFVDAVSKLKPGRALDLACGLGRHSSYLSERGWNVTAIDASTVAIASLTERDPRVLASVQDIEQPSFQIPAPPYDLIVDTFFFHRPLLSQIRPALLPGGIAVLAFHMSGSVAISAREVDQLTVDYQVLHKKIHTDIPTVELVLSNRAKS